MSRLTKEDFGLVGAELLDRSFDAEGILYSGAIPKPKSVVIDCGDPTQGPLTELEQRIR